MIKMNDNDNTRLVNLYIRSYKEYTIDPVPQDRNTRDEYRGMQSPASMIYTGYASTNSRSDGGTYYIMVETQLGQDHVRDVNLSYPTRAARDADLAKLDQIFSPAVTSETTGA